MTCTAHSLACCLVATLVLSACGGGHSSQGSGPLSVFGDEPFPGDEVPPGGGPTEPILPPALVVALQEGGQLREEYPALVLVNTLADSGLQIGYAYLEQQQIIDTDFIEEQWEYMQQCLGETGMAPLLLPTARPVEPLTESDDVLRHIDGSLTASASVSLSGSVLQVWEADLDGSLGVPGYNLRQIIGRSLWTAASLPERDYPASCARLIMPE